MKNNKRSDDSNTRDEGAIMRCFLHLKAIALGLELLKLEVIESFVFYFHHRW
jgi:hypothetical protein